MSKTNRDQTRDRSVRLAALYVRKVESIVITGQHRFVDD